MDEPTPSFAACTITASNYVARALVLHDSLKRRHPGVGFWLLLIDDMPLGPLTKGAIERRGIHILRAGDLRLPPEEIANFRFAYDITEVSTAYKPWAIEAVMERSGRHVFYLDPDIEFFAPMTPLVEAVGRQELVLTPHVLQPMPRDGTSPSEADIMGSGMFNLGFLGVNRAAGRALEWWKERLKRECYSAPAEQRFTDQRWMDFAPCLFDCHISKDEVFNVAYWNADERPVELAEGKYVVRGRPLSFFHYSGLDETAPHLLTRHHASRPRVLLSRQPALRQLVAGYIGALAAAQQECGDLEERYPYGHFSSGEKITVPLRRLFLRELALSEKDGRTPPPSPFGRGGEDAFLSWLREPVLAPGGAVAVPRMLLFLRELRPDLIAAFPDPCGHDAAGLVEWFRTRGCVEFNLPARLVPPPLASRTGGSFRKLVPGLEIIGYLRTESGVGQAARLLARALEHSSVPFCTLVDSSPLSRQNGPFKASCATPLPKGAAYECCVLCVNADSVASVRRRLGRDYFRDRRVAGLWFWEVETFPPSMHSAFQEVDEVWVASDFIRRTLAPISPVPVHLIPLPFGVAESTGPLDRRALGIPEGFLFLFSFDFFSVFRRKNPLGVIEAFKLAFREGEGPSLVIKGINGESHTADLEHLRHAAGDRRDIIILSDYMDAAANQALTAACDCYVSLHRSEGLGLTMAEAMMQRKPVIATAYSGNMDFMNEENSYLCRFEMEAVGPGAVPYCSDALWAKPDVAHAAKLMRHVFEHPEEAAEKGRRAAENLAGRFNPERCAAALAGRWIALREAKIDGSRDAGIPNEATSFFSAPVKALQAAGARPLDAGKVVPSLGTMLFQGPRRILKTLLRRLERHFKPLDEALVNAACEHDRRIANLERTVEELRELGAGMLRELRQAEGGQRGEEPAADGRPDDGDPLGAEPRNWRGK